MIKIASSCDVWMMTKSLVSVAGIVGYNHYHTPRHRIKEVLDVSLKFSSSWGIHIWPKIIWCSSMVMYPRVVVMQSWTTLFGLVINRKARQ
ncbi:hypothetical protein TNCV_4963521 [Trichonephila clavipes]|nr:hypothetical protein TNCV_4963521 [Trichonephila clavipes]